ncbi:porin family protein [Winogradskyella ursingii]|uniref:hypothetical protein n=1 Tax=Winogradskyella ursingii TaxID=2686079 RepID=UPI0015CEED69|nr:hypothetical protein [Winogradskyella ursingii]
MKLPKNILLAFVAVAFVTIIFAQRGRYAITNSIGIQGGITQFDIITDNFETKSSSGYIGGLSAAVDLSPKWYNLSYNIQLSENNIDISASPIANGVNEFVEYKMLTAQISFLLHAKLIGNYLTFDIGPMLQYNGELELNDQSKSEYIIANYNTLTAEDITDVSKFNVNGAVGLSAGFSRFLLRAQYQYGFTNILGKLNDQDLNLNNSERFEGNQSLLAFMLIVSF